MTGAFAGLRLPLPLARKRPPTRPPPQAGVCRRQSAQVPIDDRWYEGAFVGAALDAENCMVNLLREAASGAVSPPPGKREDRAAHQGHSKKGIGYGLYRGVSVFAEVFAGFGYRDMGAAYEGDGEVAQCGERPCSGA